MVPPSRPAPPTRGLRGDRIKAGALQEAIFNSAYFSSIATDDKGVIQIFNVGAERMLGYAAADVVDRITPADISDPEELIARAATLSAELDTPITPGFEALVFKASRGIEDIYELTYVRKDGTRFPAIVSVTALRDAGEHIIGYLLIGTDNTVRKQVEAKQALLDRQLRDERKRFERTLQQTNTELERANRMKSEFLATMSHELRTPLNAIVGFSEALKDGLLGPLEESQQEYIGDIFTSGQHLLSLINDILDLSKVEAGMMSIELEPVDLHGLLASSLSIVREKAAAQRVALELDAEDVGTVLLDLRKTKQIVYNLLSNAVKFSSRDGRVVLAARRVPRAVAGCMTDDREVHGFPLPDGEVDEFLEISVADGGIGIGADDLPSLFKAFSQIDSSLARKFEGTGLGLAMVKQLTELHGGTVAVASGEGLGSRFAAWLPMRSAEATGAPVSSVGAPRPTNEPIALMIEDDDRAAGLVRTLLEGEGFTVLHAANTAAAIELAPRHKWNLITLDVKFPATKAWDALSLIRQDSNLARVPVVMIAESADSGVALVGGAASVLQKPVSQDQLKESLAELGMEPAAEGPRTVLVIDDDPRAVELIAAFLPSPAYAVVRAYGGEEGIALAKRIRPDLVLVDLMMPEVSGFDVVVALQGDPATSGIPVLAVTAKEITASDVAALTSAPANVVRVVGKEGFTRDGFMHEVRRALAVGGTTPPWPPS